MSLKSLNQRIFNNLGIPQNVAVKLFKKHQLRKVAFLTVIQSLVGLLDLFSLLVLSLMVSKGLSHLSIGPQNGVSNTLPLESSNSSFFSESNLILLLSLFVTLTLLKIVLAPLTGMQLLRFLSAQSANIASKYLNLISKNNFSRIRFGKSQDNLSAIGSSMDWLVIGYLGSISMLISEMVVLCFIFCGLIYIDWITTIVLFALIAVVAFLISITLNKKAYNWSRELIDLNSLYSRRVLDGWLIYRETILSGADKFSNSIGQMRQTMAKHRARLTILPNMIKYIFEGMIIVISLITASIQYFVGSIDEAVSTFIVITVALSKILPSVLRIQTNILSAKQYLGLGAHALEIISENLNADTVSELSVSEKDLSPQNTRREDITFEGSVEVRDVSFTYPDSDKSSINSVSFNINKNQKFAITGPSGSGKSTLIDLILGFLTPQQGSIRISGLTPKQTVSNWPGFIAYVPQDVYIFEGTVLENITLGISKNEDRETLEYAISIAGLSDVISALPDGVRTHVGERGIRLSGGQKQRLGIARALYGKPKVLILDEATSSLDATREAQISLSIEESLSEVTMIIVAHRLSTIRNADSILYLEDGCIGGIGTFDELVEEIPKFKMLVNDASRIKP